MQLSQQEMSIYKRIVKDLLLVEDKKLSDTLACSMAKEEWKMIKVIGKEIDSVVIAIDKLNTRLSLVENRIGIPE